MLLEVIFIIIKNILGTGKTFLINLIVHKLLMEKKIVFATSTTGIAASLIYKG